MAQSINWRQAFAEVGLLLLGALIALGVDSARDERVERAAEANYLASLRTDLLGTQAEWEAGVGQSGAQEAGNAELIALLSADPPSVEADSILALLQPAFLYLGREPVMATYQDLVNSGDLDVLRSDTLRYELAHFSAEVERTAEFIANEHVFVNEQVFPFLRSRRLLLDVYRGREGYGLDDAPPGRNPDLAGIWDGQLQGLVATKSVYARTLGSRYQRGIDHIAVLLELIDATMPD